MVVQSRGKNVAIAGIFAQLVFTAGVLAIGLATNSAAAISTMWLLAGGVPLWGMVTLLFYCRQLERREASELEDIARASESGTIFERQQDAELRPAARRVAWVERWVAPVFVLLWAAYHVAVGALMLRRLSRPFGGEPMGGVSQGMLFAVLIAFLGFLLSRYAVGMARRREWRPLRSGGSYLLVCVLFVAAVAAVFALATQDYAGADTIVAYIVPLVQLVLGAELAVNFVMDIYRPRVSGQEQRLAFDSRLLGLIAEPGRVGHSIAEALNYQFGFEVSRTWFYQIVSRAFVPLVVLGAAILLAMTSLVVVRQGETYVVLHWGRPTEARRMLAPGLHFKWPWPIDTADRFYTGQIHEMVLGAGHERDGGHGKVIEEGVFAGREMELWTEEHGAHEEHSFLIAVPPERREPIDADADADGQRPPVSLIKLVVPVHYRIVDVWKYGYGVVNPDELLEAAAYREMVRYCASATLDRAIENGAADRPEAIMTFGRGRAAEELQRRIQTAADRLDLGVEIVYVGIMGAHPPAEAAEAYQAVLSAEREQDRLRYEAEAEANAILASVAGDPTDALKLALAIRRLEELRSLLNARRQPGLFADALQSDIERISEDIRTIESEIDRERLLGQLRPGRRTPQQQLLDDYQAYRELLTTLRDDPESVDLPDRVTAAGRRADELFGLAAGEPAAEVARAIAARWDAELSEKVRARLFNSEVEAFEASPNVYILDRWLDVLDRVLPDTFKYVLTVPRDRVELRVDWQRETQYMQGAYEDQDQTGR